MQHNSLAEHVTSALAGATVYPIAHAAHGPATVEPLPSHAYTIALSREEGVPAHSLAQNLAEVLGWKVYDHELIELIAREMGVDIRLLERLDERNVAWLEEALNSFMEVPAVSEGGFIANLRKTIAKLGRAGNCIIVGRGAAHILPVETTLRVRLIASHRDRVQAVAKSRGLTQDAAAKHIETTERERERFIRTYFYVDPRNPMNYDLVLNLSHLSLAAGTQLLVGALQAYQASAQPLVVP